MKKRLVIITIILFICLLIVVWLHGKYTGSEAARSKTVKKIDHKISTIENSAADEQKQTSAKNYVCPKHPSVIQSQHGKCPRCGETLIPSED